MPNPFLPRPRTHRQRTRHPLALTAIVGAVGLAIIPVLADRPAAADAPTSPCLAPFVASAAADLITLKQLDLSALGLRNAMQTGVLIGSSRTGLYAGAQPITAARAGLVGSTLRDSYVYQTAPPTNPAQIQRSTEPAANGQVLLGRRNLTARASLHDQMGCTETSGPVATATEQLLSTSVVNGLNQPVLALPAGADVTTRTSFVTSSGRYHATAVASTAGTDLSLFGSTTLRVTGRPTLKVAASGVASTSTVEYTPATITVAPSSRPGQFQAVTGQFDLAMSRPDLDTVLYALGATWYPGSLADRIPIARISPGPLVHQNLGWSVRATAAALRVQILLRPARSTAAAADTQLAEFTIGGLEALAYAPVGGYTRPGSAATPPTALPAAAGQTKWNTTMAPTTTQNLRGLDPASSPPASGTSAGATDPAHGSGETTDATTNQDRAGGDQQAHSSPSRSAKGGGHGGGWAGDRNLISRGTPILEHHVRTALIVTAAIMLIGLGRLFGTCAYRVPRRRRKR